MRKVIVAAVACVLLVMGGLNARAQSLSVWWIAYTQDTECTGNGMIVYNYAVLIYLYGLGQLQSYRNVIGGQVYQCRFGMPSPIAEETSQ